MVCYLDILGFSGWYSKTNKRILNDAINEVINGFKSNRKEFLDMLYKDSKDVDRISYEYKPEDEQYIKMLLQKTKIVFLSDSIIISVPILYKNTKISHFPLFSTLIFTKIIVSDIAHKIMRNMNLFIRGAIAYGNDYSFLPIEEEYGNVIQSKVLINAVKIEKNAIYPRVVIDDTLFNKVYNINDNWVLQFLENNLFTDFDCKKCLNLYSGYDNTETKEFKNIIENSLQLCLSKKNKIDSRVLEKILYLVRFHNIKAKSKQLKIDVDKIFIENYKIENQNKFKKKYDYLWKTILKED